MGRIYEWFTRAFGVGKDGAPPGVRDFPLQTAQGEPGYDLTDGYIRRAQRAQAREHAIADAHFDAAASAVAGRRTGNQRKRLAAMDAGIAGLPAFARSNRRQYGADGAFVARIQVIEELARYVTVHSDIARLDHAITVLQSDRSLRDWVPDLEGARAEMALVQAMVTRIREQPGMKQRSIYAGLNVEPRRAAILLRWCVEEGVVTREKVGSQWEYTAPN